MAGRREEHLVFGAAFVGLGLAGFVLVSAGSALWEAQEGIVFSFGEAAASILPGNRDVPVSIFTGVFAGLLALFLADCTKRLQLIVVAVVLALTVVFLNALDNVVGAVMNEPAFFVIPTLLTALIVPVVTRIQMSGPPAVNSVTQRLQLLRFPAVTTILYLLLAGLIGTTTLEYTLINPGATLPLVRIEDLPASLVVTSGIVAVPSLAVFLGFRREASVVTVSSDTDVEVTVISGLYNEARSQYYATPEPDSKDKLTDSIQEAAPTARTLVGSQFKYLPPGNFGRPIVLSVGNADFNEISRALQNDNSKTEMADKLIHYVGALYRIILRPLRSPFSVEVDNITDANQLLLLTEYPSEKSEDAIRQLEEVFTLYNRLKKSNQIDDASNSLESVKIVVAHADRANEEDPLNKFSLAEQISRDFEEYGIDISLEINRPREDESVITIDSNDFFPVSSQEDDSNASGFDILLNQL